MTNPICPNCKQVTDLESKDGTQTWYICNNPKCGDTRVQIGLRNQRHISLIVRNEQ